MRCLVAHAAGLMFTSSACFGVYDEASVDTERSTTSAATSMTSSSSSASSSSTGGEPACPHLNILILTDVSISMAPFAEGIIDVLLGLGTQIDAAFDEVGTYNIGIAFNAPPVANENAAALPEGQACTQLGALLRGQGSCVDAFDGRPFLTQDDELGAGLTCIAGGLIEGIFPPPEIYETPRPLDTLVSVLDVDNDAGLAACNAGFYEAPEPLLVIVIVDAEDESEASVLELVTSAVATQGTSLAAVGMFVIGADASVCPGTEENACGAKPACRVQEFVERGLTNVGLGDNVRRFNLCRSQEDDAGAVAADLLDQVLPVVGQICG